MTFQRFQVSSPLGSDGVELVDEDDGGRLLLGEREGVAHELRAVSDEHLRGRIICTSSGHNNG